MAEALVIGAGPAGLMAAEQLAQAGWQVVVAEAKPSPARKFLMAGKSGLNITRDEGPEDFIAAFRCPELAPMLRDFGPDAVMEWCRGLGIQVFTGSSGRVFPRGMKASPLLRAWLRRLEGFGVTLHSRWRWVGFQGEGFAFDTPLGRQVLQPKMTVLALGGASWARLGSDGAWAGLLAARGVALAPFQPANMGFGVDWSAHMTPLFGQAVKGAALCVGGQRVEAEFVISARGIEGGGVYAVSRAIRDGGALRLDLLPRLPEAALRDRLARMKPGETFANRLRKLGLAAPALALALEWGRGIDPVAAIKALPARLTGPRPLDEAISVAGGVRWPAVTRGLELRALPDVFVCGEMLDWEAPTGGYLLTACLATGRWAGLAAAAAARG